MIVHLVQVLLFECVRRLHRGIATHPLFQERWTPRSASFRPTSASLAPAKMRRKRETRRRGDEFSEWKNSRSWWRIPAHASETSAVLSLLRKPNDRRKKKKMKDARDKSLKMLKIRERSHEVALTDEKCKLRRNACATSRDAVPRNIIAANWLDKAKCEKKTKREPRHRDVLSR